MKIKELNFVMPRADKMERRIRQLMSGIDFDSQHINKMFRYLCFDNEEAICSGNVCISCPFGDIFSREACFKRYNRYARELIASKKRSNLEDVL